MPAIAYPDTSSLRFGAELEKTQQRSAARHAARGGGARRRRRAFRSESKELPKRAATDRRPRRPRPSLRIQLMAAAAGSARCAPTPTAASSDCARRQPPRRRERARCMLQRGQPVRSFQ